MNRSSHRAGQKPNVLNYRSFNETAKNGIKPALIRFGEDVAAIPKRRPGSGPLFPYLRTVRPGDRASEFPQRCMGLRSRGVTLHSYRYAWAERALKCGYPERFAQQAQLWKCMTWMMYPAGESVFQLQNHFTSKTFAPAAGTDGAPAAVAQVPFSKEAKERPAWRFTKLGEGLYQITEVKSGKALTAVASDGGGARIVAGPLAQGDEQKWEQIKTDPSKLTM